MAKRGNYLLITKENEVYTIHMTPELQDDIGTVGFVDFYDNDQLKAGEGFANVEASKTVLEVETPLAGKIVERNEATSDKPDLLNSSDLSENWLIKITDVDASEYDKLEDE